MFDVIVMMNHSSVLLVVTDETGRDRTGRLAVNQFSQRPSFSVPRSVILTAHTHKPRPAVRLFSKLNFQTQLSPDLIPPP